MKIAQGWSSGLALIAATALMLALPAALHTQKRAAAIASLSKWSL
jgi:hypothetical protein